MEPRVSSLKLRVQKMREQDEFAEEIKRRADKISSLILFTDLPWVDVAIEIENLREWCVQEAPEKGRLFALIYVNRFQRLWEQWREPVES